MDALLESYREKIDGATWMGRKIQYMSREELICIVGYLMERMRSESKQAEKDLNFLKFVLDHG